MTASMDDFHQKLAAVKHRRATSAALPVGIAPQVSSFLYRDTQNNHKPRANNFEHRLSDESRARHAATLKASASVTSTIEAINLGTARPSSKYSPWQSMAMGGFDPWARGTDRGQASPVMNVACEKGEAGWDFGTAMNYGWATGSPQLLRFVTEHVELIHNPPYQDWECCVTSGTTSALEMIFRILCNRGDSILTEAYSYPGTLEAVRPLSIKAIAVAMDEHGLRPDMLDLKLRQWDPAHGPKPSVLYTVPCGQNPTGVTQPLERRKAIYAIAEAHDLLIIEDDPYYFLTLHEDLHTATPDQYIKTLPTSYLSLDHSGRVLRLDATSKILAPGLRAGWLTCCTQLMTKFLCHTECSTTAPSGPSQVMLYKTLDEAWGHEGFTMWLMRLSSQYKGCRDAMMRACERYLPKSICRWTEPTVGMFVWINIDVDGYPGAKTDSPRGGKVCNALMIEEKIFTGAKARGVQVSRGSWFAVEQGLKESAVAFRMTFAAAEESMLEEAVRRFAAAVKEEFELEDHVV
ncbi:Aminotransferase swnA [Fulvia fulva]|uniref:Aminotransferase swnA n=1 Tax=Passalora fulva TaxID=5499 RepID=A0A9Q8P9B6_PASFU|nr:Aminotransferase swnA [Fulvia fulva]KAK4625482.1 Aminotransferase swnA [Fulvia fulva]UJO18120.1 Aminotransferase swnA [Fulvia fulva]